MIAEKKVIDWFDRGDEIIIGTILIYLGLKFAEGKQQKFRNGFSLISHSWTFSLSV